MTDNLDKVRQIMASAEDVDMPEGLVAPEAEQDDAVPPRDPAPPEDDTPDLPPVARCAELALNDRGNGERYIIHHGEDLVHVPRVGWFVWAQCRFEPDPDEIAVRRRAHGMTELIEAEIEYMTLPESEMEILSEAEEAQSVLDELGVIPRSDRTDDQIMEAIRLQKLVQAAKDIKDRRDKSIGRRLTHAKNAGNSNTINNMISEAGAMIARPLDDLDRDPLVINTQGGVLRFRTEPGEDDGGQFEPPPKVTVERFDHHRDQLLTKMMPVNLDPKAGCPRFLEFLARIQPSKEMRAFLQRWFGYSMTGLTAEQVFAFFYGSGANGKSVLVDLMAKIFGDYAASAKIESITGRSRRGGGDATPDLVPLIGARFVRTSEPDQGQQLQEGLIKELTGGEPIMVRSLNENFITVYPFFKLTMSGNHRPEIRGGDDGIWRRVMLIPFEVQIPAEERDPDLGRKLWEERDGIFNWLVDGLREYLAHGLQIPDQVRAATAEYREDSDPLATFLVQICAVTGDPSHSMRAKDLQEAFAYWLDETGRGAWKPRTIYNSLTAKQGKWRSPVTGQTFSRRKSSDAYYDGIGLLEPFRSRFETHQNSMALRQAGRQSDALL
ncbi:putative DNA primase/helicase [Gemmobacter caeni]|uniref:Putative DNA primase/helicase n=1 Tax=Gemmobacter caeni TaxID=589035 RepID=A0A2T6AP84_9RHOB|nr:DNA primase family protein [Gemmobacter caeni]PTX45623.1 putative DNA primase/helicase [Gemmobacter caeni]TWI93770.1 putative DNA primase/helicase [Gemmobacter caeni]